MSDTVQHTEVVKRQRLYVCREFFADYLTALLSRIHQDEKCNAVYTDRQKHPLIVVQLVNQAQLQKFALGVGTFTARLRHLSWTHIGLEMGEVWLGLSEARR